MKVVGCDSLKVFSCVCSAWCSACHADFCSALVSQGDKSSSEVLWMNWILQWCDVKLYFLGEARRSLYRQVDLNCTLCDWGRSTWTVLKGDCPSLCPVGPFLFSLFSSSVHLFIWPSHWQKTNFFLLIPFLPFWLFESSCCKETCVVGFVQSGRSVQWGLEFEERKRRGALQSCSVNYSCGIKSHP